MVKVGYYAWPFPATIISLINLIILICAHFGLSLYANRTQPNNQWACICVLITRFRSAKINVCSLIENCNSDRQ